MSLVVSLTYILLLRFTAGLLLWTTIIAVLLLLAYGAYSQCFTYYIKLFFLFYGYVIISPNQLWVRNNGIIKSCSIFRIPHKMCMWTCAGMWYCFNELSQLRHRPGSDVALVEVGLQMDLQAYLQLRETWIILCESVYLDFIQNQIKSLLFDIHTFLRKLKRSV